jgi:putative hydrolase of the HAD superfamily
MKTLFWDFHGTLIRAEKLWSKSLYQAITHIWPDRTITLEQLSANQHPGTFPWDYPERDYRHLTDPEKWWQAMEQQFAAISQRSGWTAAEASQVAPTVRELILEPANFHLYEDAIQTLEALSGQGWRHILLSNNFPELPALMDQLDISRFFDQQIVSALWVLKNRIGNLCPGSSAGRLSWMLCHDRRQSACRCLGCSAGWHVSCSGPSTRRNQSCRACVSKFI